MTLPEPTCRVRLTEDAVADLYRLQKKDPQIVRAVFAKMLLLERSPGAGEPLLGALVGFRKLVVGNRDYRIVWREASDDSRDPVLDIAEVWAAGVRADSEVYGEMEARLDKLKSSGTPQALALVEVIDKMGALFRNIEAHPEPQPVIALPAWLVQGLIENLHMTEDEVAQLTEDEAQALLMAHWSKPK